MSAHCASVTTAPQRLGHIPALDGLRGLAILLVILHNSDVFQDAHGLEWSAALLAHAGWIGVQLFFVLSGFLITSNLLESQQSTNYYQAFFARRTLRIFPLYYGVLFVALIVLPNFVAQPAAIKATHEHQIWLWTFLTNWAEPFGKAVHGFSHFWSLAVEEQFYLVWPFLVRRRSPHGVAILCGVLVAGALVIRSAMLAAEVRPEALYMFTICRMDALAAGAACAALIRIPGAAQVLRRYSDFIWPAGVALGVLAAGVTRGYSTFSISTLSIGYTLLSGCFAALILGAIAPRSGINTPYQTVMEFAPLRSIGKYSYAMYVFHIPIQLTVGTSLLPSLRSFTHFYPLLYALLITLLSYLAAFASYHLYERHFLKLKRRFVADDRGDSSMNCKHHTSHA